jgi:hypothetical protein
LRSLVDRIELRPNQQGKLEIDLHGDLAGILTLAGKKDRPLDQNDQSVQQVKVVAGACCQRYLPTCESWIPLVRDASTPGLSQAVKSVLEWHSRGQGSTPLGSTILIT